ncbi:MAG: NAD-dependent dehydratase [Leptothrix sp. (in: Bacteria)]|nr:NAD-dependent dehydratase [Leptothrix sp. (in: b-proteobacteria)]
MSRILVLGGTGFVGRAVCEQLAERSASDTLVVPTRRAAHAQALRPLPNVTIEPADVHDDDTLAQLVKGCDVVINLVAILHGSAAEFDRVHVQLPRRLAQACRDAGVRRLLHVSALGVGDDAAAAPSNYLRSKAAGEQVLRASGLALTVFRPSVIFGAGDRFLNLFAQIQRLAPLVPLAGSDARFQPVWVDDVARAIATAVSRADTIGQTYECTGPTVYTLSGLVRLAGRWSGHERLQLPLPGAMGRLQALAMECMPGPTLMSRDNVDSMKCPNIASGRLPGLAALGITPAALEAVAPGYLGRHQGCARLERLRAGAGRE